MSKTGDAERLSVPGTDVISLSALIGASRRLDELSTARVIGDAADAVHKAQKSGQALGTLSPAAIAVNASGAVSIQPPATSTAAYSAPERLRGSPGDRRSDVFSLGVLLWEALAHERLFEGATNDAVVAAILGGELRLPSSCNANVPAELDAICRKALARDPVDRYQSAKVMAAEISAVLDDAGYPESNEELARHVAAELASGPGLEPATSTKVTAEEPLLLETKLEAAPVLLERKKDKQSEQIVPAPDPRAKSPSAAPDPRAKSPSAAPDPRAKSPSAAPDPRAKSPTPSPSSLPAWALARSSPSEPPPMQPPQVQPPAPQVPEAPQVPVPPVLGPIPGGTIEPSSASMLGVLKPGNQTAILGSIGAAAEPAPPPAAPPAAAPAPAPAAAPPTTTAILGSNTDDAQQLASVQWHDTPLPQKAVVPSPAISEAETMSTPAITGHPAIATPADSIAKPIEHTASPADSIAKPIEHTASRAGAIPAAGALPPSDDDFVEQKGTPHPASVVVLPRSPSRGDQSKGDMLGGWGWGTDAHEAYDDDAYHDSGRNPRKRLFLAIGGAAGAILLVTVIAIAAGGSKSKDKETPAPAAQAATAWAEPPAPAPAPAPSPPPAPDPATAGSADPAVATAEPPKPEPAAEPPKPEPAKVEPPKPEPPKVAAKPEPRKPEPPKVAAKPEPRKPEPPKVALKPEPRKPEPRKPAPKVALKPEPRKPDRPKGTPVDPYPAEVKKIDPNTAYKTGFQQFVRGDSNGALTTFKASLAANPGYAPTWRGIGLVYEKIGRTSQARTAFQRYLQLAPTAGDAGQIRERLDKLP